MATMQAARRHRRHRHEAQGRPHAWGHRGHPPLPPPTRGTWGWGTAWGARGCRDTGLRALLTRLVCPVSPRQGDSTHCSHPKLPGLQAGAGAANMPGAALFINRRSGGLSGSCTALAGHPVPCHAATEPAGTTAPATTGDNGEEAAHGAGRATGHPDATSVSPRT